MVETVVLHRIIRAPVNRQYDRSMSDFVVLVVKQGGLVNVR